MEVNTFSSNYLAKWTWTALSSWLTHSMHPLPLSFSTFLQNIPYRPASSIKNSDSFIFIDLFLSFPSVIPIIEGIVFVSWLSFLGVWFVNSVLRFFGLNPIQSFSLPLLLGLLILPFIFVVVWADANIFNISWLSHKVCHNSGWFWRSKFCPPVRFSLVLVFSVHHLDYFSSRAWL